jgi:hypothetical protein
VERCAFERANLMIGATDIAVMIQRPSRTPHESNEPQDREKRGIRRCEIGAMTRIAATDRPKGKVVRGRTRFWISIVGYRTNFKRIQ